MAVLDPQKLIPPRKQPTPQLVGINVKVIKAKDLLKGTLAAKKAQFKNQKKTDERLERGEGEEKLETPKEAKKAGIKLAVPGKSFLAKAKNFINMILLGWVATRLLKFLPQLVQILKPVAAIAEFFIKVGGLILEGLITFVDWGYKAYDWTRGKIGDTFGPEGVAKFDSFASGLNKFMNLVITVGMTAAAIGMAMAGQRDPKGPKPKGKVKGIDSKGNIKRVRKTKIVDVDGTIRTKTKSERLLQKRGLSDDQIRSYKKARQGGARTQDALNLAKKTKSIKPKANWWQKMTTSVADLGDEALARTGRFVGDRWKNIQNLGTNLRKQWDTVTKGVSNEFNKLTKLAQEQLSKKILEPLMKFLEPIIRPVKAVADTLFKQLLKIPGLENVLKKIGLNTLGDAPKLAGKFGAKALPWIGGLFNLLFAYDRFANGDSIGGILETVAGGLDIAGLWPASLGIDAYLFARDMFPETLMGAEECIIGVVPGLSKFKSKVDGIVKKLPDLGSLVKMIKGDAKEEKKLPNGTGTTPINIGDVKKRDGEINSISSRASYEEDQVSLVEVPVAVATASPNMSTSRRQNIIMDNSDGSGDDSLEYLYKKAG